MKKNKNKRDLIKNMEQNLNSIAEYEEANNEVMVLDYINEVCKKCKNYSTINFHSKEFHICKDKSFVDVGWFVITQFAVVSCQMVKEFLGEVV